jgi:hypothetical protein
MLYEITPQRTWERVFKLLLFTNMIDPRQAKPMRLSQTVIWLFMGYRDIPVV